MILGIESSCDESAIALFEPGRGIVGEWVSSQVTLHAEYGGVVPDLASREHLRNFGPLFTELGRDFALSDVGEIVVTTGPGLAGCLAMGIAAGQALSTSLGTPLRAANHLKAHAYSVFIDIYEENPELFPESRSKLLPHLSLIVSGGNTLLAKIGEDLSITLVGETIDDAAGEALDKGAKLLGLGYPGGPKLEAIAGEGNPAAHRFPRALMQKPTFDFSFSGLKTSLRYLLETLSESDLERQLPDICASYQESVLDALIRKTERALASDSFNSVGLSGGVSNNRLLRKRFADSADRLGATPLIARSEHTGDNAGMIAFSRLFEGQRAEGRAIDIMPNARIDALP